MKGYCKWKLNDFKWYFNIYESTIHFLLISLWKDISSNIRIPKLVHHGEVVKVWEKVCLIYRKLSWINLMLVIISKEGNRNIHIKRVSAIHDVSLFIDLRKFQWLWFWLLKILFLILIIEPAFFFPRKNLSFFLNFFPTLFWFFCIPTYLGEPLWFHWSVILIWLLSFPSFPSMPNTLDPILMLVVTRQWYPNIVMLFE